MEDQKDGMSFEGVMVRKHSKMYVVSGLFPMSGSAICYN